MIEAGGGITLPLEDYYWTSNFEGLERFNLLTAGAGTITHTNGGVYLHVLNTAGDRARLIHGTADTILSPNNGTLTVIRANVWLFSDTNSTMNVYVYAGAPNTWPGIGFQVLGGVFKAFAMMGGSRTEVEIEDWGSSGYSKQRNLKIVLTKDVDCKFYVNGSLVATITTDIPTQADIGVIKLALEVETPSGGVDGRIISEDVDVYIKLTP